MNLSGAEILSHMINNTTPIDRDESNSTFTQQTHSESTWSLLLCQGPSGKGQVAEL